MKTCFKCDRRLPLSEFYEHVGMADGHLNKCRDCTKRDSVRHYRKMVENPTWLEKERERGRQKMRNLAAKGYHYEPDPLKQTARNLLLSAVRYGRVTRPTECQKCGKGGRIEAHHTDYSKPFDVMWLCTLCHGLQHRKEDAA